MRGLVIKVELSAGERKQLASMSRSPLLPRAVVRRAQIILMAADGYANLEIAAQCGATSPAVTFWKKRFVEHGLPGLQAQPKSRLARTHDAEALAELPSKILRDGKPRDYPHLSSLRIAAKARASRSAR